MTSPRRISSRFCSGLPCTRFVSSAAIRGSISTAITFRAFSKILTVRLPVPGPTSRTTYQSQRIFIAGEKVCLESKSYIRLFEASLVHDCLGNAWVFEDMLSKVRVHAEDVVDGFRSCLSCCSVRMRVWGIVHWAELFLGFGHGRLIAEVRLQDGGGWT